MELHQLTTNQKPRKRIGRGGKRGTYAGRGVKGQKARAGANFEPIIRPLIKRYHKLKGASYTSKPKPRISAEVNLVSLEKRFQADETVSPETLKEKGLIHTYHKKMPSVKILSKGELTKPLNFEKCSFSESAREKIQAVGGKITEEKVKRGKKAKKQLTAEQMEVRRAAAQKQQEKIKAAKKKTADKRKKEARKSKDKKK